MQHLNGNIFCAIDVETTGDTVGEHDLVQICVLPLDNNLDPLKTVLPFYIDMKPENPENAQKAAMKVNRLDMYKLTTEGFDRFSAAGMLKEWMYEKLKVPYNKSGFRRCNIIPVGHNYNGFDKDFIKFWLEEAGESYFDLFSFHVRDTMTIGAYINDRMGYKAKTPKFSRLGLKDMAKELGVEYDGTKHHDALYDCELTAKVFKQLCFQDVVGMY